MKRNSPILPVALCMLAACVLTTTIGISGEEMAGNRIAANDANIQYYGRWDRSDPAVAVAGWGAVYIKASFRAASCAVLLEDGENNFWYKIDDGEWQALVTDKRRQYALGRGLPAAEHTLTLVRRSEGSFGLSKFKGFVLDAAGKLLAPPSRPKRRLEFIGDSLTAGYGNEGKQQDRHTQNGYMAYGPQTARLLDAEWHVEARSGIGMYKTLGDNLPPSQPVISDYFPCTYFSWHLPSAPHWDFSSWQPHGVVLALGSNDFIGAEPSKRDFSKAYDEFLSYLRGKCPEAHIFCLGPFLFQYGTESPWDRCRTYIREVVEKSGDKRIHFIDPCNGSNTGAGHWLKGPDDYIGDWTHPTVAGNTKIAERLAPIIREKLGW